jgi:hypothetical protein
MLLFLERLYYNIFVITNPRADPGFGESGGSPALHIKIHSQFQRCFSNFKDVFQIPNIFKKILVQMSCLGSTLAYAIGH